jgi:ferredoxin
MFVCRLLVCIGRAECNKVSKSKFKISKSGLKFNSAVKNFVSTQKLTAVNQWFIHVE